MKPSEPLLPDEEQEIEIQRMLTEPTDAWLMANQTGTGKTLCCVEFIKRRGPKTVLVIGPATGPVVKAWKDTFTRQGVTLPFKRIDSKTPEEFENLRQKVPGIYYVGREFFTISGSDLEPKVDKKTKEVLTPGRKKRWSWGKVRPDVAIYDEIQTASNRNSTTYLVLKQLKAGYKIASSATPQGNRFQGLWSVCRWLWGDTKNPETGEMYVDNSFWRWAATWAEVVPDPYTMKKCMGEINPGAFVASLPGYSRIEAKRTPVEERKVYLDLTARQRELYDQMERDALAWINEHPMVADFPIVQRIRMRQITLGEPTLNDTGQVDEDGIPIVEVNFADDCESSKIDALHKIVEKHHPGEPLFILCDSQKFARVVTKRLGPLAAEWSGKTTHKERDRIKVAFGGSVRFIVATIPAVAEGLDGLQDVCNVEVWLSQSLNEMLNEQARGRVNRRGQKADKIVRYYLQARKTDDDRHFQNLLDQHIQQRETLRRT